MPSLRQIRSRMRSVANIHDITKAMEMISAVRFKRAEARFKRARIYAEALDSILGRLTRTWEEVDHPLFRPRAVGHRTVLLLTSDKGLCGAYNSGLIRFAQRKIQEFESQTPVSLAGVGKIGLEFFRRRSRTAVLSARHGGARLEMSEVAELAEGLRAMYERAQTDEVWVVYSPFKSTVAGRPVCERLLGLSPDSASSPASPPGGGGAEYLYEPDRASLLEPLVRQVLVARVFRLMWEAMTSEYAARMTAMKQATENGEEVLDQLTLLRNKIRQSAITREIGEIISGAEALKG